MVQSRLPKYIKEKMGDDIVVVSPDAGGVERARAFAKRLGASLAIIDKRRKDGQYKDVAHPLNNEMREVIESAVLVEYREEAERVTV